jgi:hypothetical protein
LTASAPARASSSSSSPAAAKQRSEQARNGQNDVAVRDVSQHMLAQPLGPQELFLLVTRGAEATAPAGEGHQDAAAALAAPRPRETMLDQAALEETPQTWHAVPTVL